MADPVDILNWRRLDDRITTSGQPSEAQLAAVSALGVSRVINLALHTHERALADEAATVAGLGMTYVHIPVEFGAPTEADYQRFCAAMAEAEDAPLHVHCAVNARVTAFFYRYQTEVLGIPEPAARAMLESVWRPGGVWAKFIGDAAGVDRQHQYARRDY
ncbi:protein tyrosine phosphatase family protein [Glacieibacterium sp.]|uniref:protein tyrosine phosphatase family protein n=1 Tax=Glacieibacterium sp. TaxID=2860237 RepID=UPI003AFF82BE